MNKQTKRSLFALMAAPALSLAMMAAPMPGNTGFQQAHADEAFEAKMNELEDRARMLKLVMRKLKKEFISAKKNVTAMKKAGMDEADIERIDRAFHHKVKKLINQALKEIEAI